MLLKLFKLVLKIALLCTIGFLVVFSSIEIMNISVTGVQLNSLAKLSIKQACVFFEQETYKREDTGGGVSVDEIVTRDGYNTNIGGNFYNGSDSFSIYNSLYGMGSNFTSDGKALEGNWVNYDILRDVASTNNADFLGDFYREAQMTPMNIGVPYVDKGVIDEISKWNLGVILNNGVFNEDTGGMANVFLRDGDVYVMYKGFEVNISDFDVVNVEYKVLDLKDSGDSKVFKDYTNMEVSVILDRIGNDDERSKVALVGITYKLSTRYVGVTPFGRFMGGMLDRDNGLKKVQGLSEDISKTNDNVVDMGFDMEQEESVTNGGFEIGSGRNSNLPVDTSVVYYIVR